jgi:hypothetical protein
MSSQRFRISDSSLAPKPAIRTIGEKFSVPSRFTLIRCRFTFVTGPVM